VRLLEDVVGLVEVVLRLGEVVGGDAVAGVGVALVRRLGLVRDSLLLFVVVADCQMLVTTAVGNANVTVIHAAYIML
jgi:hypothetical protein